MKKIILTCGNLFINLLVLFELIIIACGAVAIGCYVYGEFSGMLGILAGIVSFIVLFIVLVLANYFFFLLIDMFDNVKSIAESLERISYSTDEDDNVIVEEK